LRHSVENWKMEKEKMTVAVELTNSADVETFVRESRSQKTSIVHCEWIEYNANALRDSLTKTGQRQNYSIARAML